MGKRGGVEVLARAGNGEGETGRVRLCGGNGEGEGDNGKGEIGRGQQEGGDGEGGKEEMEKKGQEERGFHGYAEMPGWNKVTEFSDFVYPVQRRVPQLV